MRGYQLDCKVKQFLSYVTRNMEKKTILLNRNFVSFLYDFIYQVFCKNISYFTISRIV